MYRKTLERCSPITISVQKPTFDVVKLKSRLCDFLDLQLNVLYHCSDISLLLREFALTFQLNILFYQLNVNIINSP